MTDEIKWSELRLHDGGECPVGPDDQVRVLYDSWMDRFTRDMGVAPDFARNREWPRVIAYQVQIKPPRKIIAPWHVLPPNYRWVAADANTWAFAYRSEPILNVHEDHWSSDDDMIRIDQLVGYEPGDLPWDQSKTERPEGV